MQSKDLEPRPLSPVWSGTPLMVYWATAPAHMASCYCVTGSSALATWLIRDLGLDIFGQMGQGTTLVVSVFFGCFSHCFVICYSRVIACAKDWTSLLVFLALSFLFRLFSVFIQYWSNWHQKWNSNKKCRKIFCSLFRPNKSILSIFS